MAHQGEALQESIKASGYPISKLVQELGITRPTIYRKFRDETLDDGFVKRVQEILSKSVTPDTLYTRNAGEATIGANVTPIVSGPLSSIDDYAKALIALQQKHIKLLEDYNALLIKLYAPR